MMEIYSCAWRVFLLSVGKGKLIALLNKMSILELLQNSPIYGTYCNNLTYMQFKLAFSLVEFNLLRSFLSFVGMHT